MTKKTEKKSQCDTPPRQDHQSGEEVFAAVVASILYVVICGVVFLLFALLTGCTTTRDIVTTEITETRCDSTTTEYRERTVYIPDTVYVEIPLQTATRTNRDSTSHLENDYARSDARVNADGTLTHTLQSKPRAMPFVIQIPTIQKDSFFTKYKYMEVEKEIPIEVEKELSWWQTVCIKFFPWTLAVIIFVFCFHFRKPILGHLKQFCSFMY